MDNKTRKVYTETYIKWYLGSMSKYYSTLSWFLLTDDTGTELIKSFFEGYKSDQSYKILQIYIKCKEILKQPSLTKNTEYTSNFLNLVGSREGDIWKKRMEVEINSYRETEKPFDLLIEYKRHLYLKLKSCGVFREFEEQVHAKSEYLVELMRKILTQTETN